MRQFFLYIKELIVYLFQFLFTKEGREATRAGIGKRSNGEIRSPETFEEAVQYFSKIIRGIRKSEYIYLVNQKTPQLFAACLHHGMGRFIRNNWKLWDENSELHKHMATRFKLFHADDMSGLIMMCSYQQLNHLPLTPIPFSEHYIEYWKNLEENKTQGEAVTIFMDADGIVTTSPPEKKDDA